MKYKANDLAYMAIGAVIIAICSWISIPATVPFSMQTFGVFFVLSLLGGARGTLSVLVYVLLGVAGVPVFAEFSAGLGVLLNTTGGYIVGFLIMGLLYRGITGDNPRRLGIEVAAMLAGLVALYAFGTAWFLFVYSRANGALSLTTVLGWCVLPFIIPDLLKMALALTLARRVARALGWRRKAA